MAVTTTMMCCGPPCWAGVEHRVLGKWECVNKKRVLLRPAVGDKREESGDGTGPGDHPFRRIAVDQFALVWSVGLRQNGKKKKRGKGETNGRSGARAVNKRPSAMPARKRRRRVVGAGEWTVSRYSGSAASTIEDQQRQPQKTIPENTSTGHAKGELSGSFRARRGFRWTWPWGWEVMAWGTRAAMVQQRWDD